MLAFLDLETRSRCDIKVHSGHCYVRHDSTELLCGVVVLVGEDGFATVHAWTPFAMKKAMRWQVRPAVLRALGLDPDKITYAQVETTDDFVGSVLRDAYAKGALFIAHNGEGFDRPALERHGFPADARWADTQHKARQSGLPAGLDALGGQLFEIGKDKGQETLKRLMKPIPKGKRNAGAFIAPTAGTLGVVTRYCAQDVFLMMAAWYAEEWYEPHPDDAVREVHVAMDRRGLTIDLGLAQMLLDESERLKEQALAAVEDLGLPRAMITSHQQLSAFLVAEGVPLPNCQKVTIQTALDTGVPTRVATVLNARLACNRVTMGKAKAALNTTCPDGKMRGSTVYWGAHTGRWAGRNFQTQNLTAPVKGFTEAAYDAGVPAMAAQTGADEEDILASMLRGIITASPGRKLAMIDYNQIEARVLIWMARDEEGLDAIREGKEIYRTAASRIYRRPYESISKESLERKVGKVCTLALGYQGGPGALSTFAKGARLNLEDEGIDPVDTVNAWRDGNPLIAGVRKGLWTTPEGNVVVTRKGGLWKDVQHAAKWAIAGQPSEAAWCHFHMVGPHLHIILPSGRPLVYRHAKWQLWENNYGGVSNAITFMGVRYGKAAREATYGGRLVENCLAGDTLVLSNAGWKRLDSLSKCDTLWDGVEWVSHDGLVDQGEKEIGEWLGVRATGDHLILAGEKWSTLTRLDGQSSAACLRTGLSLAPSQWRAGLKGAVSSGVIAGRPSLPPADRSAGGRCAVESAPTRSQGRSDAVTRGSSLLRNCCPPGVTDTQEWCLDAPTRTTQLGGTTAVAESPSTQGGLRTGSPSSPTQRPFPGGLSQDLTLTGSTTTGGMSRGTCASSPGEPTLTIGAGMCDTRALAGSGQQEKSMRSSAIRGSSALSDTTSPRGEALSGLWRATGKRERVFDVLNCGPRNRFMVLTSEGPVIAHNCTQAIARDIMGGAMVKLEAAGLDPLFSVHDEVIFEVDNEGQAAVGTEIMTQVPAWAPGLPLAAEGGAGERYGK